MRKNKIIIIISVVILISIGTIFKVYTVLNVSKNIKPVTILKSIFEFEKNNESMYKIPSKSLAFITEEDDPFISYMKQNNFEFKDQLGSIYIFKKNDEEKAFKGQKVTKKYIFIEEEIKK